jgi:Cdc6-like AAA superfamily ATPase
VIHDSQKIELLVADGSHWNPFYNSLDIKLPEDQNNPTQTQIVSDIFNWYKQKDYCSAFISGQPGTGKSTIASLLTLKLNGLLCETFSPTRPGFTLSKLIIRAKPTREKPLVILFDEVDVMINDIHHGITPHKNIPIWVDNKSTFNKFLDHMRFHEHVILIMTSNLTKEQISEKYDPCYLRQGRVNLYATL